HWLGKLVNSERLQCRLWTVCYVVVLMLIFVAVLLPHPRFFQPWASVDSQNASTIVSIEMQAGRVLFFIWLAGTTMSLLVFMYRAFQVNQFLKTCQSVDLQQYEFAENLQVLNGDHVSNPKSRVKLLSSNRLKTPFCSQFHRPYIVVPEYLLEFETQKINFILRHELEHLKTGHPLQLFLQRVVETIFWFHPMVWWASQESSLTREFACDEAAIDSPQEIAQYLRTLLTIIEYGASQQDESPTPLAFGRGKSIIAHRARRLTEIARNHRISRPFEISGLKACCSLVFTAVLIGMIWLPVDVLASPRANWSPWPTWTAGALHDFGFSPNDFDVYSRHTELHELLIEREPLTVRNRPQQVPPRE
ncbi:MAG: M56 family metallopeptidase, partial [Planctomycetaceae bacterium]|nr:M56 family metallopeptidase [Planctomycetaceae bacterium]